MLAREYTTLGKVYSRWAVGLQQVRRPHEAVCYAAHVSPHQRTFKCVQLPFVRGTFCMLRAVGAQLAGRRMWWGSLSMGCCARCPVVCCAMCWVILWWPWYDNCCVRGRYGGLVASSQQAEPAFSCDTEIWQGPQAAACVC